MDSVQTSFTMTTESNLGKKSTKSVTNINPDATNGQLVALATALNNVTTNTLKSVAKVQKTELDGQYPSSDTIIQMDSEDTASAGVITITGHNVAVNAALIGTNKEAYLYIERLDGDEYNDIDLSNVKIQGQNAQENGLHIYFKVMEYAIYATFTYMDTAKALPSYKITITNLSHNGIEYSDYTVNVKVINQA